MAEEVGDSRFLRYPVDRMIIPLIEELKLVHGLERESQKLSTTMLLMDDNLLMDAEEKQFTNEAVRRWLGGFKDAMYDLEDVLKEILVEARKRAPTTTAATSHGDVTGWIRRVSGRCRYPSSPIYCNHNVSFHSNIVMGVRKRLNVLLKQKDDIGLQNRRLQDRPVVMLSSSLRKHEASLEMKQQQIQEQLFVRNKEKEEIKKMVLSSDDDVEGKVSLTPIVGMGGIGKTTLARVVFNDPEVVRHFSIREWLSVGGHDCDVDQIIMKLIEHSNSSIGPLDDQQHDRHLANDNGNMQDIQMLLQNKFEHERFLIVLDDVVIVDNHVWSMLWKSLTHGRKGSKVVVTTRGPMNLATNNVHVPPYGPLELLQYNDCLSIFESYAFGHGKKCDSELEDTCAKIVHQFNGVPLAAKVIGGYLHNTTSKEVWTSVLEELQDYSRQLRGNGTDDDRLFLPALKFSYLHLPGPLRMCFVFCSLFPKYYKFQKEKMVHIWMAHDLIQPRGEERIEDTGSCYFEELVDRFVLESIDGEYSMMHAQFFDLARFISEDAFKSITKSDDHIEAYNTKVRHVSLCHDISDVISNGNLHCLKKIRTLLSLHNNMHGAPCPPPRLHGLFLQLECIRFLDLSNCRITKLPNSIGNLKHMRYLDVSAASITKLPKSLCDLYNLQTLRVEEHCMLPKGMSKLVNLRHLDAGARSVSMIHGVGKLTGLQKLNALSVSKKGNGNRISELKDMTQLRELVVWNLEDDVDLEEARHAKMKDKLYLESLELVWNDYNDSGKWSEVLEALKPHTNLRSLKINNYGGRCPPGWLTDGLLYTRLVSIFLYKCTNWEEIPPLWELRSLKHLQIQGATSIQILDGSYTFQSLESLVLKDMIHWYRWRSGFAFPSLVTLKMKNCPLLKKLPHFDYSTRLREVEMVNVGLYQLPTFDLSSLNVANCKELHTFHILDDGGNNLEHLSIASCRELADFEVNFPLTSLKSLRIDGCPRLLNSPERLLERLCCSPSLSSSIIRGCPNIIHRQDLIRQCFATAATRVEIGSDQSLILRDSEQGCLSLRNVEVGMELFWPPTSTTAPAVVAGYRSLEVHENPYLQTMSFSLLKSLQSLDIQNCTLLWELDLRELVNLKSLSLFKCPTLVSVLGPLFSTLRSLKTDNIQLFDSLRDTKLLHLEQLVVSFGSDVLFLDLTSTIPNCFPSLKKLYICDCVYLEFFPLQNLQGLTNLEELFVTNCPRLTLDENIPPVTILPIILPISLKYLHVAGCPGLQRHVKAAAERRGSELWSGVQSRTLKLDI